MKTSYLFPHCELPFAFFLSNMFVHWLVRTLSSHDEYDKANVVGGRWLENDLNYPLHSHSHLRAALLLSTLFTFISTCLKCVTFALPSIFCFLMALRVHLRLPVLQTDAIKKKCFVCLPLARQTFPSRPHMPVHWESMAISSERSMCTFKPFFQLDFFLAKLKQGKRLLWQNGFRCVKNYLNANK